MQTCNRLHNLLSRNINYFNRVVAERRHKSQVIYRVITDMIYSSLNPGKCDFRNENNMFFLSILICLLGSAVKINAGKEKNDEQPACGFWITHTIQMGSVMLTNWAQSLLKLLIHLFPANASNADMCWRRKFLHKSGREIWYCFRMTSINPFVLMIYDRTSFSTRDRHMVAKWFVYLWLLLLPSWHRSMWNWLQPMVRYM